MVVYEWFQRFGQVLAPDENYQEEPDNTSSPFLDLVAPDPNFQSMQQQQQSSPTNKTPHSEDFQQFQTPPAASAYDDSMVECQHCHRMTPASKDRPSSARSHQTHDSSNDDPSLTRGIAQAAKAMAHLKSPEQKQQRKQCTKLFDKIVQPQFWDEGDMDKLQKMIEKDPSLLSTVTIDYNQLCPDGYTPLMAAAYANHLQAATLLLQQPPETLIREQLVQVNLQGETALHIAAAKGHVEMVTLLQTTMTQVGLGNSMPIDLLGRSPLATGLLLSPSSSKRHLLDTLLPCSPADPCVFGKFVPPHDRIYETPTSLQAVIATADMPGVRVTQEDTILVHNNRMDKNSLAFALVGVFDGHEDFAACSQFAATHVEQQVRDLILANGNKNLDWNQGLTTAFLAVDDEIKQAEVPGGSTAVTVVVTNDQIVVANLGDSRCILVQAAATAAATSSSKSGSEDVPIQGMEQLSLSTTESPQAGSSDNHSPEVKPSSSSKQSDQIVSDLISVKAMSEDHKPELETERARIENAGCQVEEIPFEENGQEHVIHKIVKLKKSGAVAAKLSMSRSFGDHEFKKKKNLAPEEQAVIAVPDVMVHERTEQDAFLVLACDGIWDVMSNREVGEFVADKVYSLLESSTDYVLPKVADLLLRECFDRRSQDNMSVVIVALSNMAEKLSPQPSLQGKALDFNDS